MPSPNGYLTSLDVSGFVNRHWLQMTLGHDTTSPPWLPGQSGSYTFTFNVGTSASGPFTPARLTAYNDECAADPDNTIPPNGVMDSVFGLGGPGNLTQGTDHWVQVIVRDPVNAVVDTWVQGPFRTEGYPSATCLAQTPTQTTYKGLYGLFNGSLDIFAPCDQDHVIWEIAAHPTGPWESTARLPVTDLAPEHTFTGLAPSTTYYFRARYDDTDQGGGEFLVAPVCSFTTLEPDPPQPPGICDPWPFDPQCCTADDTATPEQILRARRIATELLWALSGRRYGPGCPITIRPCARSCADAWPFLNGFTYGAPFVPYIGAGGQWFNARTCGCTQSCSCTELSEITLDGAVYDVVSVVENGVTLSPGAYRVDFAGGWRLVRTDGGAWPSCQDMAAPPGAADTLAVTYRPGLPLGYAGQAAFDALVCSLLKTCGHTGSCGCKIPSNARRLSRQGVDQEFLTATELRAMGLTGIPEVDDWLRVVNPYGQSSPSRVYSPDMPRARFTPRP